MLKKEIKYSYKDVAIIPARVSDISSRSECNPTDLSGYYPLITAPMSSVVDESTVANFENNKIYSIMPRPVKWETRLEYGRRTKRWIAVSLSEFEENFIKVNEWNFGMKVLIDIANGHMSKLFELVKQSKMGYKNNITIMIGNIANPETYLDVIDCGADFCRVSVGTGCGCITSSNTSIHYPIASLIDEMASIRDRYAEERVIGKGSLPKIVADGGVRNYSDAIKALALGADYVMIGSLFSSLFGSAGEIYDESNLERIPLNKDLVKYHGQGKFVSVNKSGEETIIHPIKLFYGMASKLGQKDMGNEKIKTAEGIVKEIYLTSDIKSWVENFDSYLRSAMSYTNAKTLSRFINHTNLTVISQETIKSVNK